MNSFVYESPEFKKYSKLLPGRFVGEGIVFRLEALYLFTFIPACRQLLLTQIYGEGLGRREEF